MVLLDPGRNTERGNGHGDARHDRVGGVATITADDSVITAGEPRRPASLCRCEIGTMYSFTVTSSGGGTPVTGNGTVSSATQRVTGIDKAARRRNTHLQRDTDRHGRQHWQRGNGYRHVRQAAPPGYTITANDSLVNAVEAGQLLYVADAEVGRNLQLHRNQQRRCCRFRARDGLLGKTEQVTGIDVSSLADGTLTYSATLTDTSGNTGSAVTATATLDKTAPAGYSITADDSLIGASEAAAASFTFADAEVGATYSYTITSDAGGTPVSGSGTVSSATEQVTGIDVSSLPDGTLTFSVTLTDAAGNTGSAATATTTLDTTAPAGYSITADDSLIGASEALATSFTFADAEVGATYSYTITSDAGGTPVSGSGTIARQPSRSPASTSPRSRTEHSPSASP